MKLLILFTAALATLVTAMPYYGGSDYGGIVDRSTDLSARDLLEFELWDRDLDLLHDDIEGRALDSVWDNLMQERGLDWKSLAKMKIKVGRKPKVQFHLIVRPPGRGAGEKEKEVIMRRLHAMVNSDTIFREYPVVEVDFRKTMYSASVYAYTMDKKRHVPLGAINIRPR